MPNVIEKLLAKTTKKEPATGAADPIPTGATNLTIGSALVAAIGLIANQFTDWSAKLLGPDATSGSRVALAITVIAALAVVFTADLLARGYASAHATGPANQAAPVAITEQNGKGAVTAADLPVVDGDEVEIFRGENGKVLLVRKDGSGKYHLIDAVESR